MGEQPRIDPSAGWRRQRRGLSISDPVWEAAKRKWIADRDLYPAWSDWLETALADKTAATRKRHRLRKGEDFPSAPDRLPTGRRLPPAAPHGRIKRGFTCTPSVWDKARAAWWADRDDWADWADWAEDAIAKKADYTPPKGHIRQSRTR